MSSLAEFSECNVARLPLPNDRSDLENAIDALTYIVSAHVESSA